MPRLLSRMTARDINESNRTASPLELLFDLTFVVAIAQVALQLAHGIADGHALESLGPYLMVFFAIWWAWVNFTWFASAYDTDDVLYRVLTLVQMAGVLVIAAGVPSSFSGEDASAVVIGYLVMRVGLVALWLRAAIQYPERRATNLRYAVGISVVQVFWVGRLFLPDQGPWWLFLVLAAAELSVPPWAERRGRLSWHPHHIAERYGLLAIIVLGESVFASTVGVQAALEGGGLSTSLVPVGVTGLVLLFTLWWLYFSEPAGEGLAKRRTYSYIWGYGHFGVFAALAAIGAGLEVVVETAGHHADVDARTVLFAIAIPVSVFLVLLWGLHAALVERIVIRRGALLAAAVLVVLTPLTTDLLGVVGALVLLTLVVVALLVYTLVDGARRERDLPQPEPATESRSGQ